MVGHEVCVREFLFFLSLRPGNNDYTKIRGRIDIVSFCTSWIVRDGIQFFPCSDILPERRCVCRALLQCVFLKYFHMLFTLRILCCLQVWVLFEVREIHFISCKIVDASRQTCLWCNSDLLEGVSNLSSLPIIAYQFPFLDYSLLSVMLTIVFGPLPKGWDSEPLCGITIQMIGRSEMVLVSPRSRWTPCIRCWSMMQLKGYLILWVLFYL